MFSHYTSDEAIHYGLSALPDELQELHIEAASLEVNPLLRTQAGKMLYTVWHLLGLMFVCIPYWTITSIPTSCRPRPDWSISKTVRIKFLKRIQILVARVELDKLGRDISAVPKPATLIHSTHTFIPPLPPHFLIGFPLLALRVAESRRGSWALPFLPRLSPFTAWLTNLLDPRRAERLGGSLLDGFINEKEEEEEERKELRKGGLMGTGVNGAGFWFGKGGERGAREGEGLVALNLHGGAYLTGSGLEGDGTGNHPKYLIARTPLEHVLHIEYRLSMTSPFPAPLIDAIAAYVFLVNDKGIDANRIVISGDSAGAHLALGLVRYLRDEGESVGLSLPRAMLLFSPWADLTMSIMADQTSSGWTNEATDIIHNSLAPYAVGLFARSLPAEFLSSPYLSPAARQAPHHSTGPLSFQGFPPTCVVWGEAERLRDEARELVGRLEDGGVAVKGEEIFGAIHDHTCFPSFQSYETTLAFNAISSWVSSLLQSPAPTLHYSPSASPIRRLRGTSASSFTSSVDSTSSASSDAIATPREDPEVGEDAVVEMAKDVGEEARRTLEAVAKDEGTGHLVRRRVSGRSKGIDSGVDVAGTFGVL